MHGPVDVSQEQLPQVRPDLATAGDQAFEALLENGDVEVRWLDVLLLLLADASFSLEALDLGGGSVWLLRLLALGSRRPLPVSRQLVVLGLFAPHWEVAGTSHVALGKAEEF